MKIRLFFQNVGLTPSPLHPEDVHNRFLLENSQKPYKRITKIRLKPPNQRHIATPTKLMKGVTMNRACTLPTHPTHII
jgi:hypothetical protein